MAASRKGGSSVHGESDHRLIGTVEEIEDGFGTTERSILTERRDLAEALGGRVRAIRRSRGWKRRDLAENTELSLEAIANIERGHRLPSAPVLILLCRQLRVSSDYLLGITDQT